MHSHFSRRAITASSVLIASVLVAMPPGVSASAEVIDDGPLLWLEGELAGDDGVLYAAESDFVPPETPDYGLTLDAVLALALGGRGEEAAATTALDAVEANIESYITGEAFGDTGSTYAGATGKALLTASIMGADVDDFGGVDLEARSRATIVTDGDQVGRFSDVSIFGDFSNGFGQALSISGLSYTPDGAPDEAVTFLLDQQCPGGAFRLTYAAEPDPAADPVPEPDAVGCEDDAEASADATSLAVQALLTTGSAPATVAAIEAATDWLIGEQAVDGSIGANANSTGLASQALLAAGETEAAVLARNYVTLLQVGPDDSPDELGAIAFDAEALALVATDGIDAASRDQFRRSTTQGVLAYGVGPFGQIDDYTAVTPDRLTDTRDTEPVAAGTEIALQVGGTSGVPINAAAAVLNVTAVRGEGVGFLTVWDCSDPRPETSSVNFVDASASPNSVISALSAGGEMCIYASETVDVIVDVNGYFSAGSAYIAFAPERLTDTRGFDRVLADGQIEVQVGGQVGAPLTADAAAVLNVTAVRADDSGFLTVWDCAEPRPTTSSVNFDSESATPNTVISTLSASGAVCVYSSAETDVIVDAIGAFPRGSDYTGIAPERVTDTRQSGSVGADTQISVDIAEGAEISESAGSVALNVTAVRAEGPGFLTVWNCSDPRPPTSSVNFDGPSASPNSVIAALSVDREVCVYASVDADIIVDVVGYFG